MSMAFAKTLYRGLVDGFKRRSRERFRLTVTGRAGPEPTVYFLVPDSNAPSGGRLVMYRHVDILNAAGIRAFALHRRPGFRYTWFDNATAVTHVASAQFNTNDVLVVSELDVDLAARLPGGVRHVIFNQSGHLTWERGRDLVNRHYFNSPDLAAVVVVSRHSQELMRRAFAQLDVRRVHLSLDAGMFCATDAPRPSRIAYMPRRGRGDAELVLTLLANRGILAGWDVVALDGLPHAEIAQQLRQSKIFLSFPYQEGFGLPALEAMACGNYVIGYDGFGGREFFRPAFSTRIEAGDVLGVADALERAVRAEDAQPGWCFERGRQASAFVLGHYGRDQERQDVLAIYGRVVGGAAREPAPVALGAA